MFAHAWFQHREAFEKVEREGGVYVLFKRVCDLYSLIPEDNYTIPPEAEGLEGSRDKEEKDEGKAEAKQEKSPEKKSPEKEKAPKAPEASGTVRHDQAHDMLAEESPTAETPIVKDAPTQVSTGATTRKHRHTPSTGSLVTTIFEGEEDDGGHEEEEASPPMQDTAPILPSMDFKPFEPHKEPIFEESTSGTGEKAPAAESQDSEKRDNTTEKGRADDSAESPDAGTAESHDPTSGEGKAEEGEEVAAPA